MINTHKIIYPNRSLFTSVIPGYSFSNSWIVSSGTVAGSPHCSDVWCEKFNISNLNCFTYMGNYFLFLSRPYYCRNHWRSNEWIHWFNVRKFIVILLRLSNRAGLTSWYYPLTRFNSFSFMLKIQLGPCFPFAFAKVKRPQQECFSLCSNIRYTKSIDDSFL